MVPKINVYLPDELARAVRVAGVPASAVCQRALEQAVRRVTAIRETALGGLTDSDLADRLPNFTPRARAVLQLAAEQARDDSADGVGTHHLLGGLLAEGANMALLVLRALEIEPDQLRRDLDGGHPAEPVPTPAGGSGGRADESGKHTLRFTGPAANVLELTVSEATALGHNYVGCEHLLLGLVAEPDGTAGRVLRSRGAESRLVRRAVAAALAGYVHLRNSQTAAGGSAVSGLPADMARLLSAVVREELRPLAERIDRLERHVGVPDEG